MATGSLDANGIWQYGEDDSNTTFSALLNRLGSSTSTAVGLVKNDSKGIIATTSGGTSSKSYYSTVTSTTISAGGTADITGMSMTFNAVAGRLYKATFITYVGCATADGRFQALFTDGSNNVKLGHFGIVNTIWYRTSTVAEYIFTGSGSTTLKVRGNAVNASVYFGSGGAGEPNQFFIEDIGAA